jgi:WD40 repeat protein
LDWSSENYIAVGLDKEVYTWSACNNKVVKLCDFQDPEDMVCSVEWSQRGSHLAVGNNFGQVMIYDTVKQKVVRELQGHSARVGYPFLFSILLGGVKGFFLFLDLWLGMAIYWLRVQEISLFYFYLDL